MTCTAYARGAHRLRILVPLPARPAANSIRTIPPRRGAAASTTLFGAPAFLLLLLLLTALSAPSKAGAAGLRSAGRMPGAKRNAEGPGDEPGSKKVAGGSAETLLSPLIASIFHPEERKKTVPFLSQPWHLGMLQKLSLSCVSR